MIRREEGFEQAGHQSPSWHNDGQLIREFLPFGGYLRREFRSFKVLSNWSIWFSTVDIVLDQFPSMPPEGAMLQVFTDERLFCYG